MTDRDRLIEKIDYLQKVFMEDDDYDYFHEFLADRLLADKDIIVPPCKVGDTVYMTTNNGEIRNLIIISVDIWLKKSEIETIISAVYEADGFPCYIQVFAQNFGKTVFLTKEEAEAKLKEREGK